jgi:hypothetical protein
MRARSAKGDCPEGRPTPASNKTSGRPGEHSPQRTPRPQRGLRWPPHNDRCTANGRYLFMPRRFRCRRGFDLGRAVLTGVNGPRPPAPVLPQRTPRSLSPSPLPDWFCPSPPGPILSSRQATMQQVGRWGTTRTGARRGSAFSARSVVNHGQKGGRTIGVLVAAVRPRCVLCGESWDSRVALCHGPTPAPVTTEPQETIDAIPRRGMGLEQRAAAVMAPPRHETLPEPGVQPLQLRQR